MSEKCEVCKKELKCEAGCSAHRDNWYCPDPTCNSSKGRRIEEKPPLAREQYSLITHKGEIHVMHDDDYKVDGSERSIVFKFTGGDSEEFHEWVVSALNNQLEKDEGS